MMASSDPWKTWPLNAEVTNGTKRGVIVRSPFKSVKTGDYLPMVRLEGLVKRVWPWEEPRWSPVSDADSERAHRLREDERMAADYAGDQVDNRRTRDGRATLPKWSRGFRMPARQTAATAPAPPARREEDDGIPF